MHLRSRCKFKRRKAIYSIIVFNCYQSVNDTTLILIELVNKGEYHSVPVIFYFTLKLKENNNILNITENRYFTGICNTFIYLFKDIIGKTNKHIHPQLLLL